DLASKPVELLVGAQLNPQLDFVALVVGDHAAHGDLMGRHAHGRPDLAAHDVAHLRQPLGGPEVVDEDHRRPMVASPSVAAADEAVSLADRLHSVAIHLLRRLRRTDPLVGVSAAELSALSVLMGSPRTIGELAAAEQVTPPTMSRLIRDLEQAGLVSRARDDNDGRVVWIEWTRSGEEVLTRGRELRIATLARQIGALSEADRQSLMAGLAVAERLLEGL